MQEQCFNGTKGRSPSINSTTRGRKSNQENANPKEEHVPMGAAEAEEEGPKSTTAGTDPTEQAGKIQKFQSILAHCPWPLRRVPDRKRESTREASETPSWYPCPQQEQDPPPPAVLHHFH